MAFEIRNAAMGDIGDILTLYENARNFMRKNGNLRQWTGGYPSREMVERDIADKNLYVCTLEKKAVAVFFFALGDDPTYGYIEGKWLTDKPYGVLHRIAVGLHGAGVAGACFDYCLARCDSLRLDTHKDNIPMQNAVKKHGFSYCGVIYLENGDERIAFEKIAK